MEKTTEQKENERIEKLVARLEGMKEMFGAETSEELVEGLEHLAEQARIKRVLFNALANIDYKVTCYEKPNLTIRIYSFKDMQNYLLVKTYQKGVQRTVEKFCTLEHLTSLIEKSGFRKSF